MTDGPSTVPPVAVPRDGSVPGRATPPRLLVALVAGGAGVVLLIVGTFLPWVVSGGIGRNIYAVAGVADKLGLFDTGPARAIPNAVSLLGPACLLPVVLALLRLRRTAAVIAIAFGTLGALLGIAAMIAGGRADALGIQASPTGPGVVLSGGLLLLTAGIVALTGGSGRAQGHIPATAGPNDGRRRPPSGRLDEAVGHDGSAATDHLRRWGRDVERRGEL